MAILIDLNHLAFSSYFASVGNHGNKSVDVDAFRKMLLSNINIIMHKFKHYGEVVLAFDSKTNWRKDVFEYYKARRKINRDKSDVDWSSIYSAIDVVTNELVDNFPYHLIRIDGAEADDVIAVLAKNIQPSVIISSDKDFKQLQKYEGICQYDHIKETMLVEKDPEQFLHDHILCGDSGDDIPNIRTRDDIFVSEGRQEVMTKKRKLELVDIRNSPNHKYYDRWLRNQSLIDFDFIPENIASSIIDEHAKGPKTKNRSKVLNYIIKNRLGNLINKVSYF